MSKHSCWFFDDQMMERDYTVRLYGDGPGYSELIATALFSDNFEFEINNTWNQFEAGNVLEGLWSQIKPLAGYAGGIKETLEAMNRSGAFNGGRTRLTRAINKGMRWASEGDNLTDAINSSLIVQGTRFLYFGSSNIDMGNLMMRYTIMHNPGSSQDELVRDRIKKLLPYCIGDYESVPEDGGVMSLIGWQKPPGGYEAGYKNVDTIQKGTLKLEFGNMFYIDNLVMKSAHFTLSKVKVKSMRVEGEEPLYADVSLTFQLGGYITNKKLKKYIKID